MLIGVTGILQGVTESFRRRRKGFGGDRERGRSFREGKELQRDGDIGRA